MSGTCQTDGAGAAPVACPCSGWEVPQLAQDLYMEKEA